MLAFWKYAAWIPILISTYSAVLALRPGPLPEDNMISRVFQALSGIFMAVIMYTGTRQMSHQVHTQQKSHLLGAQMEALSDYTGLLQEMQKRMSSFRHDSRHQLRLLSGLPSRGDATPQGVYYIKYCQRNATLRGPKQPDGTYEWESPVSFWMPFNGGIGLHDAPWQAAFGGTRYLTHGSRGCVNLPYSVAETVFNNVSAGTPVVCHY